MAGQFAGQDLSEIQFEGWLFSQEFTYIYKVEIQKLSYRQDTGLILSNLLGFYEKLAVK